LGACDSRLLLVPESKKEKSQRQGCIMIGVPVHRKDGRAKVSGQAVYVDDLDLPGMLHGATVRSPIARGRVVSIHFGPEVPWHEFTIVTAQDIPGTNCISLIADDQPCLVDKLINHREEPVLLLAHRDRHLLERARLAIHIEAEPLPPVFSMEDSLARTELIWGADNVFKSFCIEKGNVDDIWSSADLIVEGEYTTGAQEQLYLETNGMVAECSEGCLTVSGSMQCPYYVQKALTKLFAWSDDRVRIVQLETGGGFGGKEEYPSMIAAHAALLAWKSGKPVKLVYDRSEDLSATTKRHPAKIRHRTAVRRDGKLMGMEIDFTIDGGAYTTLTPVVLSRGAIHAAGPYECPNVRIRARAVATNLPPHGAFRGFGAPQTLFALERQMNRIAGALGLPPEEMRRRNFIRKGQATATGQKIREEVIMDRLLDRALAESGFYAKQASFARENPHNAVKRGLGLAAFLHGAGFTGSGERYLSSIAGAEATREGGVRVLSSGVEMGQGARTSLAQIVASALRLPFEQIDVAAPDTANVPNSGPTVASRTCMVIGKLVERAALDIRDELQHSGLLGRDYSPPEFTAACAAYIEEYGPLQRYARYQAPDGMEWDDEKHQGDAYGTFAWAIHVAEVSVDTATWQTRVEEYVAVQEVGRVIHPVLAAGQIEGGVTQGIGYALYENVVWKDGSMENSQMTNYIVPTSVDIPRIRVFFEENPYPHGPMGAKGIGELPIDGPAPAIVNAIENAVGIGVNSVPVLPEVLMQAMEMQSV
jgi:CO/xanthine dehydrogenase Mo-binding subunit